MDSNTRLHIKHILKSFLNISLVDVILFHQNIPDIDQLLIEYLKIHLFNERELIKSFENTKDKVRWSKGIDYIFLILTDLTVLPDMFRRNFQTLEDICDFIKSNVCLFEK